jgi:hypothetical protein
VRGKTGDQAEYNRPAVEKLKAELESPNRSVDNTSPEEPYAEDLRGLLSILLKEIRSRTGFNVSHKRPFSRQVFNSNIFSPSFI